MHDQLTANAKACAGLAAMAVKPLSQDALDLTVAPERKAKRAYQASGNLSEHDIQRVVMEYLKRHPKVAFVGRFNSGTAQNTDDYGNTRFTRFNSVRGFSDIHGMLKGGRALYVEVKSKTGRATADQQLFIDMVTASGGLAFIARSVEDVIAMLA